MQYRAAILLWLLCCQFTVAAYEIRQVDVHRDDDDAFRMAFEVVLNASQAGVYQLITDYASLHRLNDIVLESSVINEAGKGRKLRQMLLHSCVLFFCKNMRVLEQMEENGSNEITATIIPGQSDFHEGISYWRVLPGGPGQSRLLLNSTFRPAFWVPPLVGTWLIKSRVQHELAIMSQRIETLVKE